MPRRQSSTPLRGPSPGGPGVAPRPRRRFGQNFLAASAAVTRIVEALELSPGDRVLEIGPGRGALTEALLARVPNATAIEIDLDLAALLRARWPADRLRLIEGDVLDISFATLAENPLVVAGNLPYNISKPLAMKLVDERLAIERAVLMFQKEVADRLVARPGTGDYGPLTVLAGRAYTIERLFVLPPGAFRPRPKVDSTVTRWRRRDAADLPEVLVAPLKQVLRTGFARRRQTLLRNLREGLPGGESEAQALLRTARVDGSRRAESVTPEEFLALAAALSPPPGRGV